MVKKMSLPCATNMGTKLMNFSKSEKVGPNNYGSMLKKIQVLEESSVPAKKARKLEGQDKYWKRAKKIVGRV